MRIVLILLASLCLLSSFAEDSKPPDEAKLDMSIAAVLPKPDEERWLQIPWRMDFAAARAEANEKGKPIFLWMMDGHPLGCT